MFTPLISDHEVWYYDCMTPLSTIRPGMPAAEAASALYRAHGNDVFALGLKMCGNRPDAEDLLQETFLRAYRDWASYKGDSSPTTWLYAIAVRVCRRMHRRRKGEPARMIPLGAARVGDDDDWTELPAGGSGPLEGMVAKETRSVVQRALARLPLHYRLPLALKELTEFTVDEIAELLALKPATVRSRVHRARLHLAREIRGGDPDGDGGDCPRICRDLLEVKQRALDENAPVRLPSKEHCAHCRSFLESLDVGQRACRELARREVPPEVRRVIWREISAEAHN